MPGRPPTTVEGEVRAVVRTLGGFGGVMDTRTRLAVMEALLHAATNSVRFTGAPDRDGLVRLAAHAQRWAEEIERPA